MRDKSLHIRLSALDGLRGFAMILVFLNHIPTSYVQGLLPQALFGWIWSNGVTGVTFLFILSGFLMSSIYPSPASGTAFLQKRYTRIFPLFLTMSAVMFVLSLTQKATPLTLLSVLIGFAIITHVFWVYGVKKLPKIFGKTLFFIFLTLQIIVGLFYVIWIDRHTFVVFNTLPFVLKSASVFLVNATLTLPLGQYIPMLDGVYWTLVAEVLFYVLYPVAVVPLGKLLSGRSMKVKILFLLSLIPFFGGIHILSYKIFVLSLIQPALFFYFATGVFLGYIYRNYSAKFTIFSEKIFHGVFSIIPFILFFAFVALVNDLSFLGQTISPWVRMLFAIPLTFLVAVLLDHKTLLSKFFSTKALVFIGMISYSIYLSHSIIIHIASLIALPVSPLTDVFYILVVFAFDVGIASILFYLLERPYFHHDTRIAEAKVSNQKRKKISGKYVFVCIVVLYLVGVFAAYQSQNSFNFFSYVQPLAKNNFLEPHLTSQTSIQLKGESHILISISPAAENLGILSVRMHHTVKKNAVPQALDFSISQKGKSGKIIQATYSLDEFNNGRDFPFGFPQISANNTYIADFSLTNPKSDDFLTINPDTAQLVYAADKRLLLTHPMQFLSFVSSKLQAIFTNNEATLTLILLLPVLFWLFILW